MRRRSSIGSARRTVRRIHRRMILAGGMFAIAVAGTASAVKLSQRDAQRIEEHTGRKPEDLSEAQLEQAINDLDIETQELTDADVAPIKSAGHETEVTPGQTAASAETAAAAPGFLPDYIVELRQLAELRDKGILTSAEFEAKKKQLLDL